MSTREIINKGSIYGYLKIIKEVPEKSSKRYFECKCIYENCGKMKICRLSHLKAGVIVSCGCFNSKLLKSSNTKHGFRKNPLYNVWVNMRNRCYNKNHSQYEHYGGRDIKICKQWMIKNNFEGLKNFIDWNNELPKHKRWKKGLEIDRKNNDKGYNPKNCQWVTKIENINNRRSTLHVYYKGIRYNFREAIDKFGCDGLTYKSAYYRFKRGWSIEKLLSTPLK